MSSGAKCTRFMTLFLHVWFSLWLGLMVGNHCITCYLIDYLVISAPATMTETQIQLTGWKKYINTSTIIGRRNIALGTYGVIFVGVVFYNLFKKKKVAN